MIMSPFRAQSSESDRCIQIWALGYQAPIVWKNFNDNDLHEWDENEVLTLLFSSLYREVHDSL